MKHSDSRQEGKRHAGYCWPATLLRGSDVQLIVYLDLNHWINLAKAFSGHSDGRRHQDSLRRCLQAAERGQAVFPISHSIYAEILKIGDRRQRSDLRKVIERLSGFFVVTNRAVIVAHEVEALFDRWIGPNPNPVNTMSYLDWGVMRAMGRSGAIRVLDEEDKDVTSVARQQFPGGPEKFDSICNQYALKLNRRVLEGPAAEDEASFRAQGWRPELILEGYDREAEAENEFARHLDQLPRWRRGRLRDAVSMREIKFQIAPLIVQAASERGLDEKTFVGVFRDREKLRRAFDAMPSFDASVTLKTALHRNAEHQWKNNHIHDIHALASTLPYCDVVVTDREMAGFARRTKIDQRLGVSVLNNLEELAGGL